MMRNAICQISNILLDLDGTLTDPKQGITRCIQSALSKLGVDSPESDQLEWCIGPPLKASFARLLKTTDETLLQQAVTLYRERFSEIGQFENRMYPNIRKSLHRIAISGIHIFLSTAKPGIYAKSILDYFSLTPFFDGIYGSELNGRLTDKSDLVAHILEREKLPRKSTLIAGDRCHDVIAGKKNGIMTAAVTYGYGSSEELESSRPDLVFNSFTEFTGHLIQHQGSVD